MALLSLNYNSPTLGKHQRFTAILPEHATQFNTQADVQPMKAVLLLHGLSSDETLYVRYSNIERLANEQNLAVIMPSGDHSGYINMVYGHSYYDYVLEVFDYAHQMFPLSKKREDNYVCGLSMGGYGAIKYALTQTTRFSKACMLSAVYNSDILLHYDWTDFSPQAIYGNVDSVKGTDVDVYHLLERAQAEGRDIPELFIMCGTEDELYPDNKAFKAALDERHIAYRYDERAGGHDWDYWNDVMPTVVDWLTSEHTK